MKMVVYSRKKTEKQQQESTESRGTYDFVPTEFGMFINFKIQGLKVSPVPRQASPSKAFKGLQSLQKPFLLDLGEKK